MEYKDISENFYEENDSFDGNIEGYIVSTKKENLLNFLNNNTKRAEKIYNLILSSIENIMVIKNLNIDEEFRGNGFGKEILENKIKEENPNGVILLCSNSEDQIEGFDLEEFYKSLDFDIINETSAGALMVYPSELAKKIKVN